MSKTVNSVSNSSTFKQWVESTNNLVDLASFTVTVAANSIGDVTTGNGYVNGIFGAENLVVGASIGGGTVGNPNTLYFVTNTNFAANVTIIANTIITSNSIIFAANSTTNNITITANTTTSVVNFGGTYVIVNSNLISNGTLSIPVGNTSNRPTNTQNGLIRFNSDTSSIEYVSNNSWFTLQTTPINANNVVFTTTSKIPENNVQDAIEYLSTSVVQIQGNNTISGGIIVVNVPGGTLPTDIGTTSVIHTIQAEGTASRILADATRNNTAFSGKRSNGTTSARTALANNDLITVFDAYGHTGNSYSNTPTVSFSIYAAEAWSAANNGSYATINTTPTGANASVTTLLISKNSFIVNSSSMNVYSNVTFAANANFLQTISVNNFIVVNATANALNVNTISSNTLTVAKTLTVNGSAVWTTGNMGSGSGLDADTLDGHDYTYFQTALGYTPLNSTTYTASDILTKLKTVDGVNSGLDADLLDGHTSAYFQPSLGYTPVQQGGGAGQGTNKVYIGWGTDSKLHLQIDSTNFSNTWPVNINGDSNNAVYLNGNPISTTSQYIANTGGVLLATTPWSAAQFVTISYASTVTINMSTLINGYILMNGNMTLATPTNQKSGQSGVICLQQDGTGNRTINFSSAWKFPFGITPSLSTGANEIDLLFYMVIPGSYIYGNLIKGLT